MKIELDKHANGESWQQIDLSANRAKFEALTQAVAEARDVEAWKVRNSARLAVDRYNQALGVDSDPDFFAEPDWTDIENEWQRQEEHEQRRLERLEELSWKRFTETELDL